MSTPYAQTPRVPAVPHSTPLSAAALRSEVSRRLARPPVLNPFDKFSQGDFDAWIGGITGALRHALGQAEVEESATPSVPASQGHETDSEQDESFLEDSFAEIKLRREITKGKARDPREGPGLGEGWNKEQPIEILSDSEDGDGSPEPMQRGGNVAEDEESEENEEDQDPQLFGEDEEWDEEGSPEVEGAFTHARVGPHGGRYGNSLEHVQGHEGYDYEEADEDYGSSDNERSSPVQHIRQQPPIEIIDLESDGEDQLRQDSDDELEEEGFDSHSSPAPLQDDHEAIEEDELEDGGLEDDNLQDHGVVEHNDKEDEDRTPVTVENHHLEVPHLGSKDEFQPLEVDTSFPPKRKGLSDEWAHQPDIRDPWSGPRTYAEDYYSGGDAPLLQRNGLDVHHLEDDDDLQTPLVEEKDGAANDDSAFLPEHPVEESSPLVEVPNVWEGPETYAEDYYSGGDFKHVTADAPNPHQLGAEANAMDIRETKPSPDLSVLPTHEPLVPLPVDEEPDDGLQQEQPSAQPVLGTVSKGNPLFEIERPPEAILTCSEPEVFDVDLEDEHPQGTTIMETVPIFPRLSEETESDIVPDGDFDLEYPEMPQDLPLIAENTSVRVTSPNNAVALDIPIGTSEGVNGGMHPDGALHPRSELPMPEKEDVGIASCASTTDQPDGIPVREEAAMDLDHSDSAQKDAPQSVPVGSDVSKSVQDYEAVVQENLSSERITDEVLDLSPLPENVAEIGAERSSSPTGLRQKLEHHGVGMEEMANEDTKNLPIVVETVDKILSIEGETSILGVEVENTEELQYSVDEATSEEGNDDEDAYGEEDNDEVEVLSVSSSADLHMLIHIEGVEEIAESDLEVDDTRQADHEVPAALQPSQIPTMISDEEEISDAQLASVGSNVLEPVTGASETDKAPAVQNPHDDVDPDHPLVEQEEPTDITLSAAEQTSGAEILTDISEIEAVPTPDSTIANVLQAPQSVSVDVAPTDTTLEAVPVLNVVETSRLDVTDSGSTELMPAKAEEEGEEEEEEAEDGNPTSHSSRTLTPPQGLASPREFRFAFGTAVEMTHRPADQTFVPYPASLSVPGKSSSIPPHITPLAFDSQSFSTVEGTSSPTRLGLEEKLHADLTLESNRVFASPRPLSLSDPYPASLSNPLSHDQDPFIGHTNVTSSGESASVEKATNVASTLPSAPHSPSPLSIVSSLNSTRNPTSRSPRSTIDPTNDLQMSSEPVESTISSIQAPPSPSAAEARNCSPVDPEPFLSRGSKVLNEGTDPESPAQSRHKDTLIERSSQGVVDGSSSQNFQETLRLTRSTLDQNETTSSMAGVPPAQPAASPPTKRKRGSSSPKKGPRSGTGSNQKKSKSAKGKDKFRVADYDVPADEQEIRIKPRKRSKLQHSTLPTSEGTSKPTSQSGSIGSSSSALSAARLLQVEVLASSRASSVASSIASDQSDLTQPSPTTQLSGPWGRGNGYRMNLAIGQRVGIPEPVPPSQASSQNQLSSVSTRSNHDIGSNKAEDDLNKVEVPVIHPVQFHPSLFHAHGKKRNPLQQHRTMPIQVPVQAPVQPSIQPPGQTPVPAVSDTAKHQSHSHSVDGQSEQSAVPPVTPTTSQPVRQAAQDSSIQAAPQTPDAPPLESNTPVTSRRTQSMKAIPTNSPVTRSHCRFHKISIPKDEGGPRIFFIVPGCSLTKFNIIEDEEIEDHGDATLEDISRRVEDIESLGFAPYLIAVLKSLVGSDIMRDGEIFYLPFAGETIVRQRPMALHPLASSSRGSASSSAIAREAGTESHSLHSVSDSESDEGSNTSDSDYEETKPVPKKSKLRRKAKQAQPQPSLQPRKPSAFKRGRPPPMWTGAHPIRNPVKRPRPSELSSPIHPNVDDSRDPKRVRVDDPASPTPGSSS